MYEYQRLERLIETSTALKTCSRELTRVSTELIERSRETITSSRALLRRPAISGGAAATVFDGLPSCER
jgi:hypothetical protein